METILPEKAFLRKVFASSPFLIIFILCLLCLSSLAFHFLTPHAIVGDGIGYAQTMGVLDGGKIQAGFVPNRILTTFLGLETIIFLSKIFGSVMSGWMVLNIFFYFVFNLVFYAILKSLFKSEKVAFLGGLLLASNYATLSFGINYLMDIGGWTFYILSIFFTIKYYEDFNYKNILIASACVGIGSMFKEYAFLGFIPILSIIFWQNRRVFWNFIRCISIPSILSFVPVLCVYGYVYLKFNYTYLDWFGANKVQYVYVSRTIEYIKSFGSLFNLLGLLCIGGAMVLWKRYKDISEQWKVFIVSFGLSVLPVFLWPAITQRVLFITVPFSIYIASFFIKKYEDYFYWFFLLIIPYVLASFFMDSFILGFVNLPF